MRRHIASLLGAADMALNPTYRVARCGLEHVGDATGAYRACVSASTTVRSFMTSSLLREPEPLPDIDDEDPFGSSSEELSVLNPRTRRSGLIAVKVGMTQEWNHWGERIPLTALWIDECEVVQVKRPEKEGYLALQVGCGHRRMKRLPFSLIGHFNAAGVPLKRKLVEFRVTEDAVLPVGSALRATHFVAGQYVDVTGITIGKGFQGVMKRWGFAGQPASHGNSLSHRAPGSIGACQDPGKVFKGKKLPGRMGGKRRTVQNCLVWKIDPQRNLLYVRGQVPGSRGNFVLVRDSVLKQPKDQPELPVPTCMEVIETVQIAPKAGKDPYQLAER